MGFVIAYKTVEQCVFPNETTQSGPSGMEGGGGIDPPILIDMLTLLTPRRVADYAHRNIICPPSPRIFRPSAGSDPAAQS